MVLTQRKETFSITFKFTPERTQSNAWLWEHQHEKLRKLSRRLESIIGLKVENEEDIIVTSEAYQVNTCSCLQLPTAAIK